MHEENTRRKGHTNIIIDKMDISSNASLKSWRYFASKKDFAKVSSFHWSKERDKMI